MPFKSEAQRRAMFAAASGHSTLGIPKKVGEEFAEAGPAKANLPERVEDRPSSSLEAMTGLKRTHRGKRSRGKGPKTAQDHHAELAKHMDSGDHAKAKSSALMLAKALHASKKSSVLTSNPKALL